ncbi:MAG: ATP-dependent DNA helicase PcrA [Ruminococcaceae bacterium]|nr:ATP-dependent DNA helicase PcrA [Oscillospiraceae bacterium]
MLQKYTNEEFIKLRKRRIDQVFSSLNDMQKQAVLHTEGPLLLLAGAGSGKTTVLINRIYNLMRFGNAYHSSDVPEHITDDDADLLRDFLDGNSDIDESRVNDICALRPANPWSILAITFTNKAAKEIKDRLEQAIGPASKDIWAATFHSACVRILRREIDKIGFDKSFTIYDAADSERVIKDILRSLEVDEKMFPPKGILNVISRAKEQMILPAAFAEQTGGEYRMNTVAKVYDRYQTVLKQSNALDFDDIILHTVTILQQFPDVRAYYQRKFQYVMIDEYQDTNHIQYLLSSLLAGGYQNFCVVGDDDQSIYRFRGATVENILEFEDQYPNAKVIRLEQNYRSTDQILTVANKIIANNSKRKEKKLWTENQDGELPKVYCAQNEAEEASYVADQIMSAYRVGRKWSDYAVLYRINALSNQIERVFQRNAIPYRVFGGMRFFDRKEIKDMLAYLWVVQNPSDQLRLKRIINVPARKIGSKLIENIESIARDTGLSMFEVMQRAESFPLLKSGKAAIDRFVELIESLRESLKKSKMSDMYDLLVTKSGYAEALISSEKEESKTQLENIWELKSNILEFESREGEPGLDEFLAEISLFTDLETLDGETDAVTVMTIHSAKGLEFPTVFVIGMEDGIFPSYRSLGNEEEIEEERRLMYVATTRAKRKLHLTRASSRMLFGQTSYNRASKFLDEIPPECVEVSYPSAFDRVELSPSRRKETPYRSAVQKTSFAQKTAPAKNTFEAGNRLRHKTFGTGMVVSVKPMAGDFLLEIAFDNAGTKRLLYNTASQYLEKE